MRHYTRKPEATVEGGRLRREIALVEQKLWVRLRAGALDHLPIVRQHKFGPYVVDFWCAPLKLAFEIAAEPEARNSARTRLLKDKGIKIVRVWSEPGDDSIDTTLGHMRVAVQERRDEMGLSENAAKGPMSFRERGHPSAPPLEASSQSPSQKSAGRDARAPRKSKPKHH